MPVPSSITELSTTASLNSPAGSESPGIIDDIQRAHAAFIAELHSRTSNINNTSDSDKPLSTAQAATIAQIIADLADPSGASLIGYGDITVEAALDSKADETALDGKAGKGDNSDITSLSGLTTALSIEQGGTGVDSLEAFVAMLGLLRPKLPVFGTTPMSAFGDSYTAGMGSAGYNSYPEIIGAHLGATLSNRAVSGTGITKACTQAFTYLPAYGMKRRLITLMAGFNDLYRQGPTTKTLTKLEHATKAFLANAFLKGAIPASDASVIKTGIWSPTTAGILGEKAQSLGGSALIFNDDGLGKISWSFTGDSVVVGCWDSDGGYYVMSDVDVYIDGAFIERVVFNNQSDGNVGGIDTYLGLTHTALVYTGFGSGSHTIELRGVSTARFFVDYFGALAAPSDCPSVLVGDVCFLSEAGYAYEYLRSIEGDKQGIAAIRRAVNFFADLGFPVASVPVNDFYDVNNHVDTDNLHPNVAGHRALSRAFISMMQPALLPPTA